MPPAPSAQEREGRSSPLKSVNLKEVHKFNGIEWWDGCDGEMKPLLSMNAIRVPFIRDGLRKAAEVGSLNGEDGLKGFRILDVGCGGGILSEGLAKEGAEVVGIDPGSQNHIIAQNHLPAELKSQVTYLRTTVEEFAEREPEGSFDAVVMSEVLEHMENPMEVLKTAVKFVKPGGSVFISLPNRTIFSWFGQILMGEYILRILPVGTHSWKKFLTPKEIQGVLKSCGLQTVQVKGVTYNPISNVWSWTPITKVHYALHAVKPKNPMTS